MHSRLTRCQTVYDKDVVTALELPGHMTRTFLRPDIQVYRSCDYAWHTLASTYKQVTVKGRSVLVKCRSVPLRYLVCRRQPAGLRPPAMGRPASGVIREGCGGIPSRPGSTASRITHSFGNSDLVGRINAGMLALC